MRCSSVPRWSASPDAAATWVVDAGRETEPLSIHLRRPGGSEDRVFAQAVVDASRHLGHPEPARRGRTARPSARRLAGSAITYRVPDLDDEAVRARFAGKHTVIAGSGHSALTAIVALAGLEAEAPGTRITWAVRRGSVGSAFGGGESDELPARGALGLRAKKAVDDGLLTVVTGFRTAAVESADKGQLALVSDAGTRIENVDNVVTLTGFRPDLSWLSEIPTGPRPRPAGTDTAGASDRPERPLLRHGLSARRERTSPPRTRRVPGGDEELRPCADVPGDDRVRAGSQHRRRTRR